MSDITDAQIITLIAERLPGFKVYKYTPPSVPPNEVNLNDLMQMHSYNNAPLCCVEAHILPEVKYIKFPIVWCSGLANAEQAEALATKLYERVFNGVLDNRVGRFTPRELAMFAGTPLDGAARTYAGQIADMLREKGELQGIEAEARLARAVEEHARANHAAKKLLAESGRYAKFAGTS